METAELVPEVLPVDVHLADPGRRRSLAAPGYGLVNLLFLPFKDCGNAAIRVVPCPTGQS